MGALQGLRCPVTGCQPPTSLHCYKNGQLVRSVAIEAAAKMYLPWWHRWWSRDANRPAGSIAVTLSQVDSTGGISHFGGCYNTEDAARAPNNRNWAQLIIVFFYLGLVLRLFGDSLNCAVCDTVGDFAAAAMADDTLQHQCMYALVVCSLDPVSFATDVLRVLDACVGTAMMTSGRRAFARPSWDEMLQNYALRHAVCSAFAIVEIMRKLGRPSRVHALQGFVTSLLFNPDRDKSLSALAWMGLASSRSTHESVQQQRAAESQSRQYDGAGGGFPEVPSKSLIVGMYDNIGMRLRPGYVQFIILMYMIVTVAEQESWGMLEPENHVLPERQFVLPNAAAMSATDEAWAHLDKAWSVVLAGCLGLAELLSDDENAAEEYAMDHDEPNQVHTIDMDKDWKLHKHRGSAGLHVDPEPQNSALVDHEVFGDQLKDGCGAALRAAQLRYNRRIAAITKLEAAGTMSAEEVAVERNETRWRLDATNSHIYNSTNVRDVDHMGPQAPSKRGLVVEDSGRQDEGDMFRTNKINMLPLVRLDLSKLDVVNLIANFFCSWRDNLVGTGESGLLERMGIFVTCDGQPARALLGLKRSKFYCFPGGFHMTLELWRCVQKLFWECLLLQEFTMWRLGEGQEKYIYSPSDPT